MAIKIPPVLEKTVELWQNKHSDFGVRWVKPKNLHITLIPPWYVDENQLLDVINKTKEAVSRIAPFEIGFNKVSFGPSPENPRLIWAEADCSASAGNLAERPREAQKFPGVSPRRRNEGETTQEFIGLKNDLEDTLFKSQNSGFYKKEQRQPKLHLTIARFKSGEIDKTKPPLDSPPHHFGEYRYDKNGKEINKSMYKKTIESNLWCGGEAVNWKMYADSVEVMESKSSRGGVEYTILESVPFY